MVTQTYWKSFIKMQLGRFRCLKWFRKVAGSFFLGYPRFKFKYFIYCIFIIICVAFGPQNMQTCAALYQQVWCFSCDFPGFVEESTNFLQNVKTCTWEQKRISIEISGFHCIIKHASPNLTNILFTKKLQSQAIIPEIVRLGINYGLPVQILENI